MLSVDDALSGLRVWPHHRATIARVHDRFVADPEVRAVLLTGSLAHGFATEASDVDIVIVVDEDEWERRRDAVDLTFFDAELATYPGGYVDGKFVAPSFLRDVARRGSDAARWAFDGARVLFSREPELTALLDEIVAFPVAEQAARRDRFAAQLLAWRWYAEQGREKADAYVQTVALSRIVLFACRLVLNENETLYPFHKWLLRVTGDVPHRPDALMTQVADALAQPSAERIDTVVDGLFAYYDLDRGAAERTWGAHFMDDTELAWLPGPPPVDDL